MVTMSAEAIGRMSCNPAIGGLGKGHIVREVDALGGLMGQVIDATGIQFRMLNKSKGPAVWAPRAQADRQAYADELRRRLSEVDNLEIIEGVVQEVTTTGAPRNVITADSATSTPTLDTPTACLRPARRRPLLGQQAASGHGGGRRVTGVRLEDGRRLNADAVILTTGTFMRAIMHCGQATTEGGRVGEPSARGISACLLDLGLTLGRLKTGTPPRLDRDSLDYDQLDPQPGDEIPTPFSFMTDTIDQPQIECWITYTNERTHRLIRDNLHLAPMYTGQIEASGPRYCPSIEDKVVRFADKPRHQLFLEPEGYDSDRIYCNGISTSLPEEVQHELVRTIPGLERARIVQPGYAVEYDFVPTHQTKVTLETKAAAGLYLAGQLNGTSGYEEAAGQGLMAGINAARKLAGGEDFVLRRDQAYIGVMLDDLVTRPPTEPYRMFTSRAEHRLLLRCDNADQRLTPIGREVGLVDQPRWQRYERKMAQFAELRALAERAAVNPGAPGRLVDRLKQPGASATDVEAALGADRFGGFDASVVQQLLIEGKYSGYLARQQRQVDRLVELESLRVPEDLDFDALGGLRLEAREKFAALTPRTIGQASRIGGISPADITTLLVYLTARRAR
ncbi:MAG: tRNA uridine-5-carboxymethylaminomethyl(34) synthesis enzyme MnmG [Planctomycetes bacterium]|nr:tRNA uridine-5-carboxymethylaminomethyl(34) synthesis enzyme MnmG [Planctomycetota bacterium]